MANTWKVADARHRFSELVDAAVSGRPQFIRRRDGREVVLVSREHFEQMRRAEKVFSTGGHAGEEDDAFDVAMRTVREGPPLFGPVRDIDLDD